MWLWTCRAGFEGDLAEELGGGARGAGPALVQSAHRPDVWPVFARTGFPPAGAVAAEPGAVGAAIDAALAGTRGPWALHVWVPDADETNPLSSSAETLERRIRTAADDRRTEAAAAVRYGGTVAQVCVAAPERAVVGAIPAQDLPTLAPGGRARSWMPRDSPSRAARKLVEALDWLGFGPEPGEACVDLGAAPGGWTSVLLHRRARVVAVDPARLAAPFARHRSVRHVQASAFDWLPDRPADWLLCDMAWRPLEVAALLAKWGRRRLARHFVANVKLPMKKRVEFVRRILAIVAEGGWTDLRARHLYHDREELTLAAWRS